MCELEDKDFDFIVGGAKTDQIMWENIRVFRKGKKEELLERDLRTTEDQINDEAEKSRLIRAAKESQPGQLKRPEIPAQEYHPNKGPK